MKKILALAIAVMMICACTVSAFAAEKPLADVDSPAFWGAHSEGIEITAEGVDISFLSTSYAEAASNWEGPMYILYTADEAKVNGAGYVEYWVQRGDNWGWNSTANTGDMAALNAMGVTMVGTCDNWDALWANYVANCKAGCEVKIHAALEDGKAVVTMELQGLKMVTSVPVPADKTVYLSLSGEKAKLTGIKVITPDAAPAIVPVEDGKYILSWGDLTFAALEEGKTYGYCPAGSAAAPQDTDVVTITNTADGKFTMQDSYGRYIYMKGNYNSFNVGAEAVECYEWILEDAGEGKVYLKNVGKEKYVSYSEKYTTWGSYADKADSGLLVIAPAATLEPDPTEPVAPSEPAPTEPVAPIEPPVDTGDAIGVVVALLAVSGTALVVLKKKEN